MRKIVYLIAGTYRAAGMERVLADKSGWLASHGWDVTIITTEQKGRCPAYPLHPDIHCIDLDIGYEDNNGLSIWNKAFHYPIRIVRHWHRLSKQLREIRPDICVSMFCSEAWFLPFIHDGSHKVLEVHFSRYKRIQYARKGLWGITDRIRSRFDGFTAKRYERFVVLTEQDAAYWGKMKNLSVIPNPINMTFQQPASPQNHQVIAVGRYTFQKGFDMLIKAWKLIDTKDWTLRIAGQGELDIKDQDNIKTGFSDNIASEYLKSSIFALSSRFEGLPMVLLETQAAGLPAVAFDCKCGPRDVLTDGENGFIIPEGDIRSFALALEKLMNDTELRSEMGMRAFTSSRRFSVDTIMEQWKELFEKLL